MKFGALRVPAGGWSGYDGRPQAVKNYLAYSLQRSARHIDIYRPSRSIRRSDRGQSVRSPTW